MTWNDTHLFIESRQSKSQIEWSTYYQIVQDDNYILAYYQQRLFMIVSKRFFENEQEMQDFLSKLEAGVVINKANNQ